VSTTPLFPFFLFLLSIALALTQQIDHSGQGSGVERDGARAQEVDAFILGRDAQL